MTPDDLLALIEEGLTMTEDVPLAGLTFATSVAMKLKGIQTTISHTNHATDKQITAVTNMVGALQKWIDPPVKH